MFTQIRKGVGQGESGTSLANLNERNFLNNGPIFKIEKVTCSLQKYVQN